ncbi:MAG TPA: hypothetical protein DDW52_11350 [Planctomycetaceae bacterium]|nr:hypothetical protein [Planctomycetaceae bacterium]
MPFLSGSASFERFVVRQFSDSSFSQQHVDVLEKFSSQSMPRFADQEAHVGYAGGEHLLDNAFDLGKNLIDDQLHCSVRIEIDQIPSALKNAWLKMELAAVAADNSSGRPTRKQRQEAKETIQARCEEELATGKYRRMQHYPILWDPQESELFVSGSSASVLGFVADLIERSFDVQLDRQSAGAVAQAWARDAGMISQLEDLHPECFVPDVSYSDVAWANEHSDRPDYLGNEFLLWLWWHGQEIGDAIDLGDGNEVVFMFSKTLMLECPIAENGKETISSDSPIVLAEARQAIQTGKLPRKAGLQLVASGEQYEFVLQAETLGVSGAKVQRDDSENSFSREDRVNSIRNLRSTIDSLFGAFLERRVGEAWQADASAIAAWLHGSPVASAAA